MIFGKNAGWLKQLFIVMAIGLSAQYSLAQRFSLGDHFVSHELSGSVSVSCTGGGSNNFVSFTCRKSILDPLEMDYFLMDKNIDADNVELTSKFNNKVVKQKRSFSSKKMRSENRFNLWIWTVLQTPLLDYGDNAIKYKMTKNRQIVDAGEFSVHVEKGEDRVCRHRFYNSFDANDCSSGSFICNQYFRDENYCE